MRFEQPLLEGTLLRRDKRFAADVLLDSGTEVSVHCANSGSLKGCAEPGSKVLISEQNNPKIKFKHQLEIIYLGRTPIAIHAGRPATVVAEAIAEARIPELAGYASIQRDARKHRACRIDLVVNGNGLRPCYLRAESVTLAENGIAHYPDTSFHNPVEAMQELTNLVREGNRAMVMFVAQRPDVTAFRLAGNIDPLFVEVFKDALARGVETCCYRAKITKRGIELDTRIPVEL